MIIPGGGIGSTAAMATAVRAADRHVWQRLRCRDCQPFAVLMVVTSASQSTQRVRRVTSQTLR